MLCPLFILSDAFFFPPLSPLHNINASISPSFYMLYIYSESCCRPWWYIGYHTCVWIRGSRVRSRPGSMDFFFSERKNPEYDFLRKSRIVDLRHVKEPQEEPVSKMCRIFHALCRKRRWWPKMLKSVVKHNNKNRADNSIELYFSWLTLPSSPFPNPL